MVYVGGLFPVFFKLDDIIGIVIVWDVGLITVVQMALDRINNKNDGVFDNLLPNTRVGCCS